MRYHAVYTVLFPIRLLFAGVCLVCQLTHAGLTLNDALKPEYARHPIVVGSLYTGYS